MSQKRAYQRAYEALDPGERSLLERAYTDLVIAAPDAVARWRKEEWTGHRKRPFRVKWVHEPYGGEYRVPPRYPHSTPRRRTDLGNAILVHRDGSRTALRYAAICRFCDADPRWMMRLGSIHPARHSAVTSLTETGAVRSPPLLGPIPVIGYKTKGQGWPTFFAKALAGALACGLQWYAQHNPEVGRCSCGSIFYSTDAARDHECWSPSPPCAQAMGCLCAFHARGGDASASCDTRE